MIFHAMARAVAKFNVVAVATLVAPSELVCSFTDATLASVGRTALIVDFTMAP